MDFERLTLKDWQQFADIDINFHPRATILTGANGSGKTTILSLLAKHRGWHQLSLATPKNDLKTKVLKYISLFRNSSKEITGDRSIGSLTYSNGSSANLVVPEVDSAQYQVTITNQQTARFFYIPSHRQTFSYRRIVQINTTRKERQTAFDEIQHNHINRHSGTY